MTMKKITLLAILILALLPISIKAQAQVMGVAGAGASFEDGGTFSMFVGGDIPLYTDTARGIKIYTRAGFQFIDRHDTEKEDQGIILWQMTQRSLTSWLSVAIGGGLAYNIKEGDDEQSSGVKIEFTIIPLKQAGLIIGFDYLPDAGLNGQDVKFLYAGINLLP